MGTRRRQTTRVTLPATFAHLPPPPPPTHPIPTTEHLGGKILNFLSWTFGQMPITNVRNRMAAIDPCHEGDLVPMGQGVFRVEVKKGAADPVRHPIDYVRRKQRQLNHLNGKAQNHQPNIDSEVADRMSQLALKVGTVGRLITGAIGTGLWYVALGTGVSVYDSAKDYVKYEIAQHRAPEKDFGPLPPCQSALVVRGNGQRAVLMPNPVDTRPCEMLDFRSGPSPADKIGVKISPHR